MTAERTRLPGRLSRLYGQVPCHCGRAGVIVVGVDVGAAAYCLDHLDDALLAIDLIRLEHDGTAS